MFPIHLNIPQWGIFIPYYEGLYYVISFIVAYLYAAKRFKKFGLSVETLQNSFLWIIIGAVLLARTFHFVFWDLKTLTADPAIFLQFWGGGYSITGGLLGGFLGGWGYYLWKKQNFWQTFAVASPAVFLGQAIGRVGCFLNGDAWGIPTNLPWGIREPKYGHNLFGLQLNTQYPSPAWTWSVSQGFTKPDSLVTVPLHPTQLYESLGDLGLMVLAILLVNALAKQGKNWYRVALFHLGGYSLLRFALEFLHGDRDVTVWADMTSLQINLFIFGALCIGAFFITGRKQKTLRAS